MVVSSRMYVNAEAAKVSRWNSSLKVRTADTTSTNTSWVPCASAGVAQVLGYLGHSVTLGGRQRSS